MKTKLKLLAISLLFLNGSGALYGGWNLITHPDGSSIQLSSHWLEHTPFRDYLIPGLILFVANGVFSFVVVASILLRWRNYFLFIAAQGLIILGWIIAQMLLIQTIHFFHIIFVTVSVLLVVIGLQLKKIEEILD